MRPGASRFIMVIQKIRQRLSRRVSTKYVDALVEGSVLRSGRRVCIVAQLIDASTDPVLWTETDERDFADVRRLLDEMAEAIVWQIKVAVTPEENARPAYEPRIKPISGDQKEHFGGMMLMQSTDEMLVWRRCGGWRRAEWRRRRRRVGTGAR